MLSTKIYKNVTPVAVDIPNVDRIDGNSQVSITAEQHYPVALVNYPGVVEVTAEGYNPEVDDAKALAAFKATKGQQPVGQSGQPQEGGAKNE